MTRNFSAFFEIWEMLYQIYRSESVPAVFLSPMSRNSKKFGIFFDTVLQRPCKGKKIIKNPEFLQPPMAGPRARAAWVCRDPTGPDQNRQHRVTI